MLADTSPFQGFRAMGVFLYFGAIIATLAGVTLIWSGTFLDHLWILNLRAYRQLSRLGTTAGTAFLSLAVIRVVAGVGWGGRRNWGWVLVVVIIATQVLGSLVNAAKGDFLRGSVGLIHSSALLYFLLRLKVRAAFTRQASENTS